MLCRHMDSGTLTKEEHMDMNLVLLLAMGLGTCGVMAGLMQIVTVAVTRRRRGTRPTQR